MRSQPRFDVRDRNAGGEGRERSAERARRIALDDEQVDALAKQRRDALGDALRVNVGIGLAGAIEPLRGEAVQTEFRGVEAWMLAGQDQPRPKSARDERVSDRGKLDRFGPGSDDKP